MLRIKYHVLRFFKEGVASGAGFILRGMRDQEMKVTVPKEAATVLPLRQADGGFEVLMVRRHPRSVFVPECYVFPGGILDDDDRDPAWEERCRGLTGDGARRILADAPAETALASFVAGIRETFEETGILLACDTAGELLSGGRLPSGLSLPEARRLLLENRLSFFSLLAGEDLFLATDRLHYVAHWITPEGLPYRYDVRFFLAEVPRGGEVDVDVNELTGHVWITPSEALARYGEGEFPMVLPTIMTLREMAALGTIEEAVRYARAKKIPPILTKLARREGREVEIMPDGSIFYPLY